MTATDELRCMLDERGVEHYDGTETTLWGYEPAGKYTGAYRFAADETSGGRMQVRMFNVTPEQAIAATLGPSVEPPDPPIVPYDILIDILRDEWGIEVMWDGLRRFWYVGLTEEGVRKRDENEKLRELLRDMLHWMPCKRPCQSCARYRYPEGCEFEIQRRKLGGGRMSKYDELREEFRTLLERVNDIYESLECFRDRLVAAIAEEEKSDHEHEV